MKKHFDKNQPEPRDKQYQNKSISMMFLWWIIIVVES
jgi:hypothetical protein